MGGDPESPSKKQLGKIMLQQKLVTPDQLKDLLDSQRKKPGSRLASAATRKGRVAVSDALKALSEQHGVPPVDLTQEVVPLAVLRLIPREIASEHVVFPFAADGDKVLVAMAEPGNKDVVEEVEFVTGKKVEPHIALDSVIRAVIEYAYVRLEQGLEHFVGSSVTPEHLKELGLAGAEVMPKSLIDSDGDDGADDGKMAAVAVAPVVEAGVVSPPLDRAFGERVRPSQPPPMPTHAVGAKVLLAMAQGRTRDLVVEALGPSGLALIDARDGVEALSAVRASEPRALVIEASLENVHGFDVCRRLLSNPSFERIPILVVSTELGGWRVEQDVREVLGIEHFFDAPLDVDRLIRTLRLVIEGKEVPAEPPPLSPAAEQWWDKAMDAFDNEDLDGAIGALEEASKLDPGAFELQYHLGLLYGRRDDLFFAIQALERAVAVQPHHFSALKNLAVVYQRAGFHRKCVDSWQRALGEAPDEETRDSIKEHMMSLL